MNFISNSARIETHLSVQQQAIAERADITPVPETADSSLKSPEFQFPPPPAPIELDPVKSSSSLASKEWNFSIKQQTHNQIASVIRETKSKQMEQQQHQTSERTVDTVTAEMLLHFY